MNLEIIDKLINCFSKLPGVGRKTAERYAHKIIDMSKEEANVFADLIKEVKDEICYCKVCGNFSTSKVCHACEKEVDNKPTSICIVAEPKDVFAAKKIRGFNGSFHILHGVISPLESKSPDDLNIKSLLARLADVKEIIVATSSTIEGEATAMYLSKLIKPMGIKVTRLAQGLSVGAELEYADDSTLNLAFDARREM